MRMFGTQCKRNERKLTRNENHNVGLVAKWPLIQRNEDAGSP